MGLDGALQNLIVLTCRYYHPTQWLAALGVSSATPTSPLLALSPDGKKFTITWPDGEENTYHSPWLRHNCKCPQCYNGSADQKLIDAERMQGELILHSATISGRI